MKKIDMKKILITLLLLFSTTVFSQETEPEISETERLVDKYSGQVKELVSDLAESLKVPVEYVWEVLTKQALVESFTFIIILILGFILMLPFMKFLKKVEDWDYIRDKDNNSLAGEFVFKLILGILGFISFIIGLFHIHIIVQGIVNPEYYALNKIFELLK